MNPTLLKQLIYQAHVAAYRVHEQLDPVGYASDRPTPPQIVFEQFAELIVKECARLVNDNDHEGSTLGDRLLFDHFGVTPDET